jgi:superfamily II DNA or RNA helicase
VNSLVLATPTKLLLPIGIEQSPTFAQLQKALAYEDKRVTYQYLTWKKVQKNDDRFLQGGGRGYRHWFVQKNGREALDEKVKQLNAERYCSCLQKDGDRYWTYSGLQKLVEQSLGLQTENRKFITPEDWKLVPWATKPHESRWYQSKAVDLLCPLDGSRTHGAIEVGTGLGKTQIMALIVKRIGLPAVICVPTLSIATQALLDFQKWFGAGRVGQFFDGKKNSDKFITIAVSKSLSNVEFGDKHYDNLCKKKVLLVDETHLAPPESLSSVVFGLLAEVPYRYFLSGTVLRNDGLGTLLDAITGEIVFRMSVEQGIKEGFLSPLKFFQYNIKAMDGSIIDDPLKCNKYHLQNNANIYKHAAGLINHAVKEKNRRVLVFVDTVDQYRMLLKGGLQVPSAFAHGPLTKENRGTVPESQWKLEPMDLVKDFDNGKFPVLVATSCVSIGTDIRSADFIVNIVGLTSEIEIRQGIGRGTRLFPGKTDTMYIDYNVIDNETMARHAEKRRAIFDSVYGQCKILEAK